MDILVELKDNISDKDLDAIYLYIESNFETLTDEEKVFWKNVLEKIDPDFYED